MMNAIGKRNSKSKAEMAEEEKEQFSTPTKALSAIHRVNSDLEEFSSIIDNMEEPLLNELSETMSKIRSIMSADGVVYGDQVFRMDINSKIMGYVQSSMTFNHLQFILILIALVVLMCVMNVYNVIPIMVIVVITNFINMVVRYVLQHKVFEN